MNIANFISLDKALLYLNEGITSNTKKYEDVLKDFQTEIEKIYNSKCEKLGLHKEKGSIDKGRDNDGNNTIEYSFSTYHDPEDDWEHSFEYYESGNSNLSDNKVNNIINGYISIIKDIKKKIEEMITKYKKDEIDIDYYMDDYRGDQITVHITIPDASGFNDIIKKAREIFISKLTNKMGKFNSTNYSYTYYTISGKTSEAKTISFNINNKYFDSNKDEFCKTIKSILEEIRDLYRKNKSTFDNEYIVIDIHSYSHSDNNMLSLRCFKDIKGLYKPKDLYMNINYPSICIDTIIGSKMKKKIDPIKNNFLKSVDSKINKEFGISSNLFSESKKGEKYVGEKGMYIVNVLYIENTLTPTNIFKKIRQNGSTSKDINNLKSILKDSVEEFSKNDITVKYKMTGNARMYFRLNFIFSIKYTDSDINI